VGGLAGVLLHVGPFDPDPEAVGQVEGAVQQVKGKVQNAWGKVKDAARDTQASVKASHQANQNAECEDRKIAAAEDRNLI